MSARLDAHPEPRAVLVLGHGAGAGMEHPFLEGYAGRLVARGLAVLRYHFPYMEGRGWPPDRPPVAVPAVRAAGAWAREWRDASPSRASLPLFVGGKSFGGRMSALASADPPGLPGVAGLVFVGFPLHTAKRPGTDRAEPLGRTACPLLFLQGTRDRLARLDLLRPVVESLGPRAALHVVEDADHGFRVPRRSGRSDDDVLDELAEVTLRWMEAVG